jgi:hypothetical protein
LRAVDFLALDFAPERDLEDFLLVVAILRVLSFPSSRARESHLPPC